MDAKPYPPENQLQVSERAFWSRILSSEEQIHAYEDEILQTLARSVIPIEKLETEALKQSESETMDEKSRDFLLRELLRWFKYEFFTWTDKPKCERCQGTTVYYAHLDPTPEEDRHGARRVEGYRCETCSAEARFPRYNDPGKLLETRTGRCGEWANCFTLCCRAMGFEARFVLDWTDHVWTEVYSPHQRRWLHCDSCENACDTPLMYEEGWGKKLTYVIGFSKDEVVDVTWRYSKKHRDVWRRRLECREWALIRFIDRVNSRKREAMLDDRRRTLNERAIVEYVEFLWPRHEIKAGEAEGRSSGDLTWRQQRGELGAAGKSNAKQQLGGYVIRPLPEEVEKLAFTLEYYSASDEYRRPSASGESSKTAKWQSCVYDCKDVQRKIEHDWKMVYLARTANAASGSIVWKFECNNDAIEIDHLSIKVDRKTYENGVVRILFCQANMCSQVKDLDEFTSDKLDASNCFEIKAMFSGGQGTNAWQHAQLFRTSTENGNNEPSFVISIKFRPRKKCQ